MADPVCALRRVWAARLLPLGLLALGLIGGATCVTTTTPPATEVPPEVLAAALKLRANDHILGSPGAPILVIEYADLQCPICGRFTREAFPTVKQQYIDTGKVRWVFRHYPLRSIHPCAEAGSRGVECAGDQGKFFEFVEFLYNDTSAAPCNDILKTRAESFGLDTATFNACIDSSATNGKSARVQEDVDTGNQARITGTPTFFINGRAVVGYSSLSQFLAELDKG